MIYHAILAAGDTSKIYEAHEAIRSMLWDSSPDYVKLLAPVCHGLASRKASFMVAPHGLEGQMREAELAGLLLEKAINILLEAKLRFIEVYFGGTEDEPSAKPTAGSSA